MKGQVFNMANEKLKFVCDYMEGAHPAIMNELLATNMMQTSGYGLDEFSESARDKIRKACGAPNAEVYLLVGGTQTNATVIRCPIHMERSQPPRSPLIWILFYLMIIMSTWLCRVWSISPSLRNTEPCIPWKN